MAERNSISFSTKDIVFLIREINQPVELGLQLGIEYSCLKKFEKDHPGDIGRQMIDVIDYWLNNCDCCSWRSLAQAIKRFGGHDQLVISVLNQMDDLPTEAPQVESTNGCDNRLVPVQQLNLEEIMAKFSSLLLKVQIMLEERQVKAIHVRQFLRGLFQGENCILADSLKIFEIFSALTSQKLWTYQHYSPLEKVINEFLPSHDAIKANMKVYKGNLSGYHVAKKLIDYIKDSSLPLAESDSHGEFPLKKYSTQRHYQKLKAVLQIEERRISELSLSYVCELWEKIAEEFDLPLLTAIIDEIVEGSLKVTWLVLHFMVEKILHASRTPKSIKFFCQHNIELLIGDNLTIYDAKQMVKYERNLFLLCCTQSSNSAEVLAILRHGVDPNVENENGTTALILACEKLNGCTDIVRILIQGGANVNFKNRDGDTALFMACRSGFTAIMDILLHNGANVNIENTFGGTALHAASLGGYADIVERLIDFGASLDAPTEDGDTALLLACRYGHLNVSKLLIDNEANVNYQNDVNFGETPLQVSSANGHLDIAKELIKNGAFLDTPTEDDGTALILACQNEHSDVAKLLIQKRARVDQKDKFGLTPLDHATQSGLIEVVQTLVKFGAKIKNHDEATQMHSQTGPEMCTDVLYQYRFHQ